jgi:Protein of unknown function (DUF1571)
MHPKFIIAIVSIWIFNTSFVNSPIEGAHVLEQVFIRNKAMKKVSVTIHMKERFGNKVLDKQSIFKIEYNPTKIYVKQQFPDPQFEVLYIEGQNDNKAIVNPNSFPWMVLKLDPLGSIMRKDNHHSIYASGYSFFIDVLEHLYNKYKGDFTNMLTYEGITQYSGVACHKIVVNNPNFSYTPYKVQAGENLEILAHKFFISDYMVFEKNPEIKSFEELKPGMTINIPTDYAKVFILYIDAKTFTPVTAKIYDDIGLFEEYDYLNVNLAPSFTDLDFDRKNPQYGFK